MKILRLTLGMLVVLFIFSCMQTPALAQEKGVGPIRRYVRDERGPNDWVVEFLIPANANWRIEASGEQEKKVLRRSSITDNVENNRRRIVVTTGGRARAAAGYIGRTIDMWANALTVYYRVFEPRGPARRP